MESSDLFAIFNSSLAWMAFLLLACVSYWLSTLAHGNNQYLLWIVTGAAVALAALAFLRERWANN